MCSSTDVGLTSDFISGFCGETEADHEETVSLMNIVKYNFAYCFAYSSREVGHHNHRQGLVLLVILKHLEIHLEMHKYVIICLKLKYI